MGVDTNIIWVCGGDVWDTNIIWVCGSIVRRTKLVYKMVNTHKKCGTLNIFYKLYWWR